MSPIQVERDSVDSIGDVESHVYITYVKTVITISLIRRGVPQIVDILIHDNNTQQKFIASLNQHLNKESVILYDSYVTLPSAVREVLDAIPLKKYGVSARKSPLVCVYTCIYLTNMTSMLANTLTLSTLAPPLHWGSKEDLEVRGDQVSTTMVKALSRYLNRMKEGTLMPDIGLGAVGLPFEMWSEMIQKAEESKPETKTYTGTLNFVRKSLVIATDASFHPFDKTHACIGIVSAEGDFMQSSVRVPKKYAEVMGIVKALSLCRNIDRNIVVLSDSMNAVNLVNQIFGGRESNLGGVPSSILNLLYDLKTHYTYTNKKVMVSWVKGHDGDILNEAAHSLAIRMFRESHYQQMVPSISWKGNTQRGSEWDFCESRVRDAINELDKVVYRQGIIQRAVGRPVFYRGQIFYGKTPVTNPLTVNKPAPQVE